MKKLSLKIYLVVILLFVLPCSATAGELIIIAEDAAPNTYIENGLVKGKAAEVVQAVLKEVGMGDQVIKIYPWSRGYRMLETRSNVALFPTSRTKQRESLFKWAGPIADNDVNLYKLRSREDIQPKTLEDLKQFRAGSAGGPKNMKTQFLVSRGFDVELVDKDRQNIDKLFAGRIDFIPYAETRLSYDIRKYGYNPEKIEKIWNIREMSSKAYIAFSRSTDDAVVEKIQKGFDTIKQKGIQEKILDKWK